MTTITAGDFFGTNNDNDVIYLYKTPLYVNIEPCLQKMWEKSAILKHIQICFAFVGVKT